MYILYIYIIYIYTYIYTYISYIYTHTHTHTYIRTCTHAQHTCTHKHTNIYYTHAETERERSRLGTDCVPADGRVLRTSRTAAATTPSPGFKCPAGSPKSPSWNPVLCRLFPALVPSALRA